SIFHVAARADAARLDAAIAAGEEPGPLAGVPVAVKDLFDVRGVVTLAGSVALAAGAPAAEDATAVGRLRRAGATLIGATNMDEFAYGFTTENSHYGPTRNPHDPARVAGGSHGGSAAARSGVGGLVAARAGGELWDAAEPSVHAAAERVAEALGARATLELPEVGRARAAAIVITAAEGADQHQELLRRSPETVDPRV